VERKLVQHLKQKQGGVLTPAGQGTPHAVPQRETAQERVFNVVSFLLRYGPAFLMTPARPPGPTLPGLRPRVAG